MEKDKAKSQVLPISQLGIMQMTRQRHAQSNSSGIYVACPYCGGKGIVKSARTMSGEIQRKIVATCRNLRESAGAQKEIGLLIIAASGKPPAPPKRGLRIPAQSRKAVQRKTHFPRRSVVPRGKLPRSSLREIAPLCGALPSNIGGRAAGENVAVPFSKMRRALMALALQRCRRPRNTGRRRTSRGKLVFCF